MCYQFEVRWAPASRVSDGGSSNGRTADSDSASLGSNPSPPASLFNLLGSSLSGQVCSGYHRGIPRPELAAGRRLRMARTERIAERARHGERPAGFGGGDGARSIDMLHLSCGCAGRARIVPAEITQSQQQDRPQRPAVLFPFRPDRSRPVSPPFPDVSGVANAHLAR